MPRSSSKLSSNGDLIPIRASNANHKVADSVTNCFRTSQTTEVLSSRYFAIEAITVKAENASTLNSAGRRSKVWTLA